MSPSEPFIGAALSAAREARGLSVEDVAARTNIRAHLIRDIEADRFDGCGGAVYARGHIRSIAAEVGIDAAPLIAAFDKRYGGAPAGLAGVLVPGPAGPPAPQRGKAPAAPPPRVSRLADVAGTQRRGPNWAAAMTITAAVVVVIAAIAYFVPGSSSTGNRAGPAPGPATHAPATGRPPATAPPNAVAQAPQTGVHVVVRVTTPRSWLHVTNAAGATLFSGILAPGTTRDFTDAQQIRMTIGYPPAVDLVVNGHDVGVTGDSTQVTHVAFGPQDPAGTGA